MKIYPRVLIIAFALSTAVGVLSNLPSYIELIYVEDQAIGFASFIVGILNILVNPLVIFVSFYLIGRRIQTNTEFYSYLLSFFVGNAVGLAFGSSIVWMLMATVISLEPLSVILMVLGSFFSSLFSLSFFVGFSALALSYIIKKRQ